VVCLVVAATFICPLELIRTKMQSVQLSYREVGDAIKSSIRNAGVLSMMRGLGPSLLRDIPFSGWYCLEKCIHLFFVALSSFFISEICRPIRWTVRFPNPCDFFQIQVLKLQN